MPNYLIYGDDEYRVSLRQREIINAHQNDCKIETVILDDDLESVVFGLSLFAEEKLLVINLDLFSGDESFLSFWDRIEKEGQPEHISILFYYPGKPDRRQKLFKLVKKFVEKEEEIAKFKPWNRDQIKSWLLSRVKLQELNIENKAVERLIDYFGPECAYLDSELGKLKSYIGDQAITAANIEELCQRQDNLFDLTDSIVERNPIAFNEKLQYLSRYQYFLQTLAGLQSVLRNYLCILALSESGQKEKAIADQLKAHPFKVKQDLIKLKKINSQELWQIIRMLNHIEAKMKTGKLYDPVIYLRHQMIKVLA